MTTPMEAVSWFLSGGVAAFLLTRMQVHDAERATRELEQRMNTACIADRWTEGTTYWNVCCPDCRQQIALNYDLYKLLGEPAVTCPKCRKKHSYVGHQPAY